MHEKLLKGRLKYTHLGKRCYCTDQDGGRPHSVVRTGRALDEADGALQGVLHGIHLVPVEVWLGEVLGQVASEQHIVHIVSQQAVVDVPGRRPSS